MHRTSLGCSLWVVLLLSVLGGILELGGCRSPQEYREEADEVAAEIIDDKQQEALGETEPFTIERPSDILRRRLIEVQQLTYASQASLGTDELEPIPHWPENVLPVETASPDANLAVEPNQPVRLSLTDALQVGAYNSPDYQSRKEQVFQSALALDLTRNSFRNIFTAQADSQVTTDTTGAATVTNVDSGGSVGVTRSLKNGLDISAAMALDLFNLLTQGGGSTLGLSADTSVSLPLLRGAGRHIITEPLTQAERNVVYQMWSFERYKRTFAIGIARDYFSVLRQMDLVTNAREDYRSAIRSARWTRRRADAGRITEVEVDQAVQRELSARNNWISAQEQFNTRRDAFKTSLGLPPDALLELDPNDLAQLRKRSDEIVEQMRDVLQMPAERAPPADAPVELEPVTREGAGPYEIPESLAVRLALEHRRDLQVANGQVYDAQRAVVVAADNLRTGLDLGGRATFSDDDSDGSLGFRGGRYAALLTLDLPLERTRERNDFRNSLISLEQTTRAVQSLEDQIKLSIRDQLRILLESRETVKIQAQRVVVAEKTVRGATLLVEAGRSQIRDLLEAQDALLAAQNQLTAAVVNYRIAELELQGDLGLLDVNEKGLWQEFAPEDIDHDSDEE
ncbi:MAG: TolC family protein [Sedimentisphaerales bacterium]|nr:TolC family protein [Sedimentisphaerales bacterium]